MEVLETLEIQNTLSNLEARLDSLEIDIARVQGTREDDARRTTGEVAVMRARVGDAVQAFSAIAEELRETTRAIEKRLADLDPRPVEPDPAALRARIDASIEDLATEVGEALGQLAEQVRERFEKLGAHIADIESGLLAIVEHVAGLVPVVDRVAALERTVEDLRAERG